MPVKKSTTSPLRLVIATHLIAGETGSNSLVNLHAGRCADGLCFAMKCAATAEWTPYKLLQQSSVPRMPHGMSTKGGTAASGQGGGGGRSMGIPRVRRVSHTRHGMSMAFIKHGPARDATGGNSISRCALQRSHFSTTIIGMVYHW